MELRKKIYLSGIILAIFNLALIFLVFFPLIEDIEGKSQELISQKRELDSISQKKENLKNLEKIYQKNQENLEKIEALFIDPEIPIEFFNFLEKTAQDSQVEIKKSLAQEKKETDFGPALSFNISLESSFANFLKFLEKLENSPYLIEISNLNIKKLTEKAGLISATFTIQVLTK